MSSVNLGRGEEGEVLSFLRAEGGKECTFPCTIGEKKKRNHLL